MAAFGDFWGVFVQALQGGVADIALIHRGAYRTGPGEIGFPIATNGTVVQPGDLILGDLDGVVCVSKEDAIRVRDVGQEA